MMNKNLIVLILINFFALISTPCISTEFNSVVSQQNLGCFYFPDLAGWNFNSAKSNDVYFVFENNQLNLSISIKKEPELCETQQQFNAAVLKVIQSLPATQEFMQQRKQAAPYKCLGQNYCHAIIVVSRVTKQKRFILNPYIGDKMYQIEISGGQANLDPPAEALNFISMVSLEPGGVVAQNIPAVSQRQTNSQTNNTASSTLNQPQTVVEDDGLSSFKKDKSVAPPPPLTVAKQAIPDTKENTSDQTISKESQQTKVSSQSLPVSAGTSSGIKLKELNVPDVKIDKGNIPEVKFSATDPCSPKNPKDNGLPWESKNENKIEIPKGVDAVIPSPIPDVNNLSDVAFNSAVSSAFEAMRLVYGDMSDDEAKKFQAAWAPLFDFPAQEIIDYLNQLNPLISQFLICREAYIRNITSIEMVLLDAATAIDMDDQQAWESAMAEAGMYTSTIAPLDAAMKQLAKRIEALGNPPSPVAAKCDARRRYQKVFSGPDAVGCWAGYQDNIFISDGKYSMIQSDNNPEILGLVYSPKFVYIFKVVINGVEKYYSIRTCMDCNLGMSEYRGNCSSGSYSDSFIRENILGNESYSGTWIDGPRQGEESQFIQKFEYPDIPEFSETSDAQIHNWIELDSKEGHGSWTDSFQKMLQEKALALNFFGTALQWTELGKWQQFNYSDDTWMCPDDLLIAFNNDMSSVVSEASDNEPEVTKPSPPIQESQQTDEEKQKAAEAEVEAIKESIAFHQEMVNVVKHNLERDVAERDKVRQSMQNSKTKAEFDEHYRRFQDLNLRIINGQSNIQAEQDLIASYQTGQLVHTRTAFDDYAQQKFIKGIQVEVERIEQTRRIAERIDRQIKLLPWEQQAKARELARDMIDGKTIASGDVEKAKRLVESFNNQIQGYAEYDRAVAKEAEVDAEQNEFYAQMVIVAAGAGAVGFGSAALAEVYGAEAAMTIYGTKVLGAIYGGATGYLAGGPKEGVTGAVSWWSPAGFALTQFVEGYQHAGYNKDATVATQIWEGAKQAGKAYIIGKGIEKVVQFVAKASLKIFGEESILFKPIVQSASQRQKQVQDMMRTTQKLNEAKDAMKAFESLERELATLKMNEVANAARIQQLEAELQQLSASMNADYYAKWLFKYKASPRLMRRFDTRIQKNYADMQPGMVKRLEEMGYNMSNIEFIQFRNGGSGGTSSMDLDLGPVMKGTKQEPRMIFKKDGTFVTRKQFMNDCQSAMNAEYRNMTGITAPSSDMNLVMSVHKEAFATSKLLDKSIDMSTFTESEIQSIGKVLKVKTEGIANNQMMTHTTKMQAQCRETSKEIENMLLRKLRSDLQKATPGSAQAKEIQGQITYWERMLDRFKQIGTQEAEPMQIIELCNQVRRETGGKDVPAVIDDVIKFFGAK